jgi:hypothetical protein
VLWRSLILTQAQSPATFTITGVSKPGMTYNAGANSDPDGDSNGTTITAGY